ncbi:hypothetical protein BJ508DRAFT_333265 [Ascobolus immersus RN42]|uniref:Uncharacterized protein n=1 Tax=Ascobolus immersus RN42 TaxID=1160509 RepID=A0A3N4HMU3_ASCIM|nr:hypothetical protein BJ508DRAFT_333265 [Ascobolus immersus RN42]
MEPTKHSESPEPGMVHFTSETPPKGHEQEFVWQIRDFRSIARYVGAYIFAGPDGCVKLEEQNQRYFRGLKTLTERLKEFEAQPGWEDMKEVNLKYWKATYEAFLNASDMDLNLVGERLRDNIADTFESWFAEEFTTNEALFVPPRERNAPTLQLIANDQCQCLYSINPVWFKPVEVSPRLTRVIVDKWKRTANATLDLEKKNDRRRFRVELCKEMLPKVASETQERSKHVESYTEREFVSTPPGSNEPKPVGEVIGAVARPFRQVYLEGQYVGRWQTAVEIGLRTLTRTGFEEEIKANEEKKETPWYEKRPDLLALMLLNRRNVRFEPTEEFVALLNEPKYKIEGLPFATKEDQEKLTAILDEWKEQIRKQAILQYLFRKITWDFFECADSLSQNYGMSRPRDFDDPMSPEGTAEFMILTLSGNRGALRERDDYSSDSDLQMRDGSEDSE